MRTNRNIGILSTPLYHRALRFAPWTLHLFLTVHDCGTFGCSVGCMVSHSTHKVIGLVPEAASSLRGVMDRFVISNVQNKQICYVLLALHEFETDPSPCTFRVFALKSPSGHQRATRLSPVRHWQAVVHMTICLFCLLVPHIY